MEIIRFEVSDMVSSALDNRLIFEEGCLIIKPENNKAYFNERKIMIVIENACGNIRNFKSNIKFMSFDEDFSFEMYLDEINEISNLLEMCANYINSMSDISEDELEDLFSSLDEFNNNGLINYSLDNRNKEMFMELTEKDKLEVLQ